MVINKEMARKLIAELDIVRALADGKVIQDHNENFTEFKDTTAVVIGGSFTNRIKPNYPDSVFLNIYDNGAGKCQQTLEKAKEVRDEDGYIKTVEYRLVADD